jgi:hypothetical protein
MMLIKKIISEKIQILKGISFRNKSSTAGETYLALDSLVDYVKHMAQVPTISITQFKKIAGV